MNKFVLLIFLIVGLSPAVAQTTLERCQKAARDNYPMIHQYSLIEKSRDFNLRNATLAQIPQVALSAKASYQTAVTSIPIPSMTPLNKDQYQVAVEVTQSVWDGGVVRSQKRDITAAAEVDAIRNDVDLYAVVERINNLFFGIMTFDEQLALNTLLDDELQRNYRNVESYISGGIANSVDLDAVSVEILNNRQNRIAIEASREAYTAMLSEMVGFEVKDVVVPTMPTEIPTEIRRPELSLYDSQIRQAELKRGIIAAQSRPRVGVYVQGVYGNPGLDMFKTGFSPYAIGGVRINWNLGSLYTRKNDLAKIEVQKLTIDNQRATFLYNTNILLTQNRGEINRIRKQMADDEHIIALRRNIKVAAEAKVAEGTMTVIEMLRELTAENSAKQNKVMHEVELLKTIYDIKYKTNN